MRDRVVVALLAVAFAACGSQSRGNEAGSGGDGKAGGLPGNGLPDQGGAPSAGRGTGGGSPASGGAGHTGSAGQAQSSGSSGTFGQGTSGSSGRSQVAGLGGHGGATVNGGTNAGGVALGGSAGSSAGAMNASGGSGAGGAAGSGGAAHAGNGPGGAGGSGPTCAAGLTTPAAGDSNLTLQFGGRSRTYILHVPSGLTAGTPLALVFDLHGAGGNGAQQKGMSGFSALADKERFLAVFPDGVDGYWNVDDKCCGTAGDQKIDDVGFLKTIITTLSKKTCIDASRIYVTGFSNGGGLAHRMGCDAADVIAAIAPTATDLRTEPCNAARPISMMEVKGMADSLEPYDGGLVGPDGGQYVDVGAKASLALWAAINQCTGTTSKLDNYCESYTTCAGGVEADLCSLPNVDHSPYNNSLGFNVASVAWSMFKRHTLR